MKSERRSDPLKKRGEIREGGFMIVEALVAMLVFALGILGLVSLQANMTREQSVSKIRADAAYLSSQLIGTMWTDLPHLASYQSCKDYVPCSSWAAKVAASLPAGVAVVTADATTGNVSITLTWTMPSGESHRYQTATTIIAVDAS
jgi:type IV pilus assembly protein PilV